MTHMPHLYYLLLAFNAGALTTITALLLIFYARRIKPSEEMRTRKRHVILAALSLLSFNLRATATLWNFAGDLAWWDYAWFTLTYGLAWASILQIYLNLTRRLKLQTEREDE